MEFGCCVSFDRYNDLVKEGFDFIELPGSVIHDLEECEFKKIRKILNNEEVKCSGFNAILRPDIKVIGQNVNEAIIDEYIDKLVYRGWLLGIETIGFGSPASRAIPIGFSKEEATKQLTEFIEKLCLKSEPYRIRILLEPLSKTETNFINNIDEALRILENIKSINKGLLIDYYHFCLEKEDLKTLDSEVAKHLYHVHMAEETDRTYLVPSKTSIYKEFLNRLKYIGYSRKVSIEAKYQNYIKEASLSLKILKKIDGEI